MFYSMLVDGLTHTVCQAIPTLCMKGVVGHQPDVAPEELVGQVDVAGVEVAVVAVVVEVVEVVVDVVVVEGVEVNVAFYSACVEL